MALPSLSPMIHRRANLMTHDKMQEICDITLLSRFLDRHLVAPIEIIFDFSKTYIILSFLVVVAFGCGNVSRKIL
jgi:hypothetical protein